MYKYLFVIIIFLFKTNFSFAQSQEEKWAIEHFEQKYSEQNFKKPKKNVQKISEFIYKYNEDSISISSNPELKLLLENNLLFPFYKDKDGISRTYIIRNLKELKTISSSNTKRFSLWLNTACRKDLNEICLINPRIYYIEVKCDKKCDEQTFYKNARLTYLGKGGIIL
ncbi:hypothetical protein [Empedobacter sp.]|uniref:hypothetical protein n=1 Tax=Empedobacter sp. TaxID=1927715 RepID=UPI00289AADFB|nr:hypothetical protein [Empedobacter sp.]